MPPPGAPALVVGSLRLRLLAKPVIDAEGRTVGRVTQWLDRTQELESELELAQIVNAAANGDFSQRLSLSGKSGFFASLSTGMNEFLASSELGLNDVAHLLEARREFERRGVEQRELLLDPDREVP